MKIDFTDIKKEKMAEWYDIFNKWDWPDDFILKKPEKWDELPNFSNKDIVETKYFSTIRFMKNIEDIIGTKECLRWHHIHNLNSNNFKFEWWWFCNHVLRTQLWFD